MKPYLAPALFAAFALNIAGATTAQSDLVQLDCKPFGELPAQYSLTFSIFLDEKNEIAYWGKVEQTAAMKAVFSPRLIIMRYAPPGTEPQGMVLDRSNGVLMFTKIDGQGEIQYLPGGKCEAVVRKF